jgi:hypothetical protein
VAYLYQNIDLSLLRQRRLLYAVYGFVFEPATRYRGADKFSAQAGRKQATLSVRMA